jgi:hypothetical protein
VPLIEANRYETVDLGGKRVSHPKEDVQEVINGAIREQPAMRLPLKTGNVPILDELRRAAGQQTEQRGGN